MSDLKFTRDSVIIVCFFSTLTKAYCIVGNGGWSNWTRNSTCSVTCGEGITLDTRSCTNPPPNDIGTSCVGESHYEEVCKKNNCACEFTRKKKKMQYNFKLKQNKIQRMLIDNGQCRC